MQIFFLALVVLGGSTETIAQGLTDARRQKLHPKFQVLLEESQFRPSTRIDMPGFSVSRNERGEDVVGAIIYTDKPEALRRSGIHVNSVYPGFVTSMLTIAELERLTNLNEVTYIDPGTVNYPVLDVSVHEVGVGLLHAGFLNNTPYRGAGAIVLIYDTGIDWKHLDFRNPSDTTKSRILAIWDQTITPSFPGEVSPSGFSYGVEYTKAHLDDELDGTPTGFVRQVDRNGHGTHVAGTAVGNGFSTAGKYTGVAPEADIIVVKGGDEFFMEDRMIDGLTYAVNKAAQFGKPIVVNWSIGSQRGSHDGTRPYEVAIDAMVATPGRVVVVSAGNDGASNIHLAGALSASEFRDIQVVVPSYTPNSGSNNDQFLLEVWFQGSQAVNAAVTSPNGLSTSGPDGTITLSDGVSAANGHRWITLWVRDGTETVPPREGTWTLRLSNPSTSIIQFDGWLAVRRVGKTLATLVGGGNSKTVSMPGTATGAITVGSFVTKWGWPTHDGRAFAYTGTDRSDNVSTFSGIGPTRDGRQKPDIAAPGQGIVAALSSSVDTSTVSTRILPGLKTYLLQGTSMSAPHVAGTAALLLAAFSRATAERIKSLLTSTANADDFTGAVPNFTWGFGKLDVLEAMARAFSGSASVARSLLRYDDQIRPHELAPTLTGSVKVAVRISPTISGKITRVMMNTTVPARNPIVGNGSVRCELFSSVGGLPGSRVGNALDWPLSLLSAATYNSVIATAMNAEVSAGRDYFIVLSLTTPLDTLRLRTDDGGAGSAGRSYQFDGSQWTVIARNLRIRLEVTAVSGLVSVEEIPMIPDRFSLFQNHPNPFNPSTTIRFDVPYASRVKLRVFDLLGREIRTLFDGEQKAGTSDVVWDGTDYSGLRVASGVYFYRLDASGYSETRKMILVR